MFLRSVLMCLLSIVSVCAKSPHVSFEGAWARPADVGYNSALYLQIKNDGDTPLVIVDAGCDHVRKVELHETIEVDGVSKMIPMDAARPWTVAPGETLSLAPGGKHVMLIGLTRPLEEGARVEVTLMTKDGEKIVLEAPIQKKPGGCTGCCGH